MSLVPSTTQRNAIVQFSYVAQQDDELDIKEGDEIEILEDVEEGWARGQLINTSTAEAQGKIGLFPTNFVIINETLASNACILFKYFLKNFKIFLKLYF